MGWAASIRASRRVKIHVQVAQPIPRPLDSLLDVDVGGEERAGDLRGAETAERSQSDGDAGFGRHRFVAADEKQAKRFVADLVGKMRFERRGQETRAEPRSARVSPRSA